MEEREKSNNDITEKKIKKQSQKDMYGVMGGFVSGILYAFFSYKIFINLVEFKIGQI